MNARLSAAQYRKSKETPYTARWAEYERHKLGWIRTNPEATQREYEKAMRELAKRLGV